MEKLIEIIELWEIIKLKFTGLHIGNLISSWQLLESQHPQPGLEKHLLEIITCNYS